MAKQDEIKAATDAKAAELRKSEGKFYAPNNPNPRYPNQVIEVIKYTGVGTIASGERAHLFYVESRNPGKVWQPPATQFLADHHEVEAPENPKQKEVI